MKRYMGIYREVEAEQAIDDIIKYEYLPAVKFQFIDTIRFFCTDLHGIVIPSSSLIYRYRRLIIGDHISRKCKLVLDASSYDESPLELLGIDYDYSDTIKPLGCRFKIDYSEGFHISGDVSDNLFKIGENVRDELSLRIRNAQLV